MFLFQIPLINSYFPDDMHCKIMGSFSQREEMPALICTKHHMSEFLKPFKWTPSPMFFPTSATKYSWTELPWTIFLKPQKAKNMLDRTL
jgi:hypothetical protein